MKIVLLEDLAVPAARLETERLVLEGLGNEFVWYDKTYDESVLCEEVRDADVVILANMPLSERVLDAAENLKYIDVAFTGVDHIPVQAARERGIQISNASGYATDSVAELVMAFMIESLRMLPQLEQAGKEGKTKTGLRGQLVKDKTVGIVGAGAIGRQVAALAKAFGCRVIGYNRSRITDLNFDAQVSLDELLENADVVTLHVPLTEDTRHLIGERELGLMRQGALLINTARGPVVDMEALVKALNQGRIHACLDVFDTEPPLNGDDPILHAPNCILTPHMGFDSEESMDARANIVFDNLYSWLEGDWKNRI